MHHLKSRLHLSELQLGGLSWSWSGWLWVRAEHVHLKGASGRIRLSDADVRVRIPMLPLLVGSIRPDRIELVRGHLELTAPAVMPLPSPSEWPETSLALQDVDATLHRPGGAIRLKNLNLRFEAGARRLSLRSGPIRIEARLSEDGLPEQAHLACESLDWLPPDLRRHLRGDGRISLRLERPRENRFHIRVSARADPAAQLILPGDERVPFERIDSRITLDRQQSAAPVRFEIAELVWQLGENRIDATGFWQDDALHLTATSESLAMPLVWSWLRPLGGKDWHDWLARMHRGRATNVAGSLFLHLPLPEGPKAEDWDGMRYRVRAHLDKAEIALGTGGDMLGDLEAEVEIDEKHLRAQIVRARLPAGMGTARGSLRIPWDTLMLHIEGHARASLARILSKVGPPESGGWPWEQDTSLVDFQLLWDPTRPEPDRARAAIRPDPAWRLSLHGRRIELRDGVVQWVHGQGIAMRNMRLDGRRLSGRLSLDAGPDGSGAWMLRGFEAHLTGDFAALSAHIQLPLEAPSGMIGLDARLDERLHARLSLTDAAWRRLLGSDKRIGEEFALVLTGSMNRALASPEIRIERIASVGRALSLSGSGRIDSSGLSLKLDEIRTPGFAGTIRIRADLDAASPWEIDLDASRLSRNALPEAMQLARHEDDRPWVLRARIDRFEWDAATLSGLHLQLASQRDSVGMLEAAGIRTGDVTIEDASARFALTGGGAIDLRQLRARAAGQKLEMSARLTPSADGGMDWEGFAWLSGNFGELITTLGITDRFQGGRGQILFAGRGHLREGQPWWKGLDGRLRVRSDSGRVLEGGGLAKLLAATNLADLPRLLFGGRKDLTGPGTLYRRFQFESILHDAGIRIRNLALRSSAFDVAGKGSVDLERRTMDLVLVVRPLQNLDAIIARIPLLRDILGGKARSLYRKVYRMHGPFTDPAVDGIRPEEAGLSGGGLVETLLSLPSRWFGKPPEPDLAK